MSIDMWYGDRPEDADGLSVMFYPNGCEYRGNLYKGFRPIGDFATSISTEIAQAFPHLPVDWGD